MFKKKEVQELRLIISNNKQKFNKIERQRIESILKNIEKSNTKEEIISYLKEIFKAVGIEFIKNTWLN